LLNTLKDAYGITKVRASEKLTIRSLLQNELPLLLNYEKHEATPRRSHNCLVTILLELPLAVVCNIKLHLSR
jgi:hypothetical protein